MRKGIKRLSGLIASAALLATMAHAGDTVYYYYNDAQGSPIAVADAQGNIVERTDYAPYGATLNRPVHDGPGYTGHEEDSATGLTYMQQRYYDSQSGQFISTDPVLPDGDTGASFNRYVYGADNPYRFTDPDGRAPDTDFGLGAMAESVGGHPEVYEPLAPVAMAGTAIMAAPLAIAGGMAALANPATPAIVNTAAEAFAGDALGGGSLMGAGAVAVGARALSTEASSAMKAISMSTAVDKAVAHVGSDAEVAMTKGGNVQFSKSVIDQSGNAVTKNARFDVNPASGHVQKEGPHLNLETQVNGKKVPNDPHIPIDPKTIRPGDHE